MAKTMAEVQLHARIKAFLDKNYPCCETAGCCGEEEEAWAILDMVTAAGYGLVADAKRGASDEQEAWAAGYAAGMAKAMARARAAEMRQRDAES